MNPVNRQDAKDAKKNLPEGWRWVRLGEVLRLRKEIVHPYDGLNGSATFVGLEHIETVTGKRTGAECVEMAHLEGRKPRFYRGDIVYGYLRPYLNKVWVAEFDGLCSVDQYVYSVDQEQISAEFVAWFMRSSGYLESAPIGRSPGQLPRIRTEEVASVDIALPPLDEQRRIAAALEEQMAAVERARAAAEARLEAAKALTAAQIRAIFGSPEAQGWARRRFGDLLNEPLRTGISRPSATASQIRCLTLSAVRNGKLDLNANKPVDVNEAEANGNWVRPEAFYIVRGNGNRSLVGRGAFAPSEMKERVLYPDLLIQAIPIPGTVEPGFLRHAWDAEETRQDIEGRARTAAGIYKINQTNLADVRVPLPSSSEQRRITEVLDRQIAQAEELRKAAETELAAINALPAALLRRAFSEHI